MNIEMKTQEEGFAKPLLNKDNEKVSSPSVLARIKGIWNKYLGTEIKPVNLLFI